MDRAKQSNMPSETKATDQRVAIGEINTNTPEPYTYDVPPLPLAEGIGTEEVNASGVEQRQSRMRALMGKMGHNMTNVLGRVINSAKEIFRPTKRKSMVVGGLGLVAASGIVVKKVRS